MQLYYDAEGDFLEVRFGKAVASFYDALGDDIFARRAEKTGKVVGYALFNVQKRQIPREVRIALPA